MLYGGNVVRFLVHFFFTAAHFHFGGAFLILSPPPQNFSCCASNKRMPPLFFISGSGSLSPFFSTNVVWLGTGQFQWSIGTNGTIGTNGKAPYSSGSIGEYASH